MLVVFLLAVHTFSLLAAWLNPLPVWLKLILSLAVAFNLWLVYKQHTNGSTIVGLQLKPDGSWLLHQVAGGDLESQLRGSSIINPWFVLLHLRTGNKPYSILIPRDSLEPDAFRRLRVALRVVGTDGEVKKPVNPL
jgi:hypothetical protein